MKQQALEGIKVLDFGTYLAGAATTMHLARLGAEVIKVEHPTRPDGGRYFVTAPGVKPPDPRVGDQLFSSGNTGKIDISVDLSQHEGKEILMELIKGCDVFYENMKPGSMARNGFNYEAVKTVKPDIIYMSSSSCGQEGPERDFVGYAANFANKSGLGALTGYEGSRPSLFVGSIDMRSANMGLLMLLTALYHRKVTGEGQYIDLASQEAIATQLGDVYLDFTVNGHEQGHMANKRAGFAPQDAYPTSKEDQWIAISISNDIEWKAFCEAIGTPELKTDPRFISYNNRVANAVELDAIIAEWTKQHEVYEAVKVLQAHKVPSSPSLNSEGAFHNPHFQARGIFEPTPHRKLGTDYAMTPPWKFSETPAYFSHPVPFLGEHTVQVLKSMTKMTDNQLDELAEKRVVRRIFDYDNPF